MRRSPDSRPDEDDDDDDVESWRGQSRRPDPNDREPEGFLTDRDAPLESDMDSPADGAPGYEPCPYCEKLLYENADLCPHCGNFINFDELSSGRPGWFKLGLGLALFGMLGAAVMGVLFW